MYIPIVSKPTTFLPFATVREICSRSGGLLRRILHEISPHERGKLFKARGAEEGRRGGFVPHAKRITIVSIIIDATLFLLKLGAGIMANSLAILADATNSLLELLASIGIHWSVNESHKRADKGHPFSNARAEPMVVFVIALLIGIAAFEFFRAASFNLLFGNASYYLDWGVITCLIIAIVAKIIMSHEADEAAKKTKSPALLATAIENRNDILITLTALIGIIFASIGYGWLDDAAALIIAIFLFTKAYTLGKKNINYLMGAALPKEAERKIREVVTSVRGVRGIAGLKAHYVGSFVHVEIQLLINRRLSTRAAHTVAMTVQHDVERLPEVNKAFIHLETV